MLYVANVGDTRAVLNRNGNAQRLTIDHKASDPVEIERVLSVGGTIKDGRVAGGLAITRALGDHAFKNYGLSSSPHISKQTLSSLDKHLILASDGVWDTVSD